MVKEGECEVHGQSDDGVDVCRREICGMDGVAQDRRRLWEFGGDLE
jgi:hypothetical protein